MCHYPQHAYLSAAWNSWGEWVTLSKKAEADQARAFLTMEKAVCRMQKGKLALGWVSWYTQVRVAYC